RAAALALLLERGGQLGQLALLPAQLVRLRLAASRRLTRPHGRPCTAAAAATASRAGRPVTPRGAPDPGALHLVRHLLAGGAEVAQRRVGQEVGHPAGVEVGVLADLRAEPAGLVPLAEDRAPVRVVGAIDRALERLHLLLDG